MSGTKYSGPALSETQGNNDAGRVLKGALRCYPALVTISLSKLYRNTMASADVCQWLSRHALCKGTGGGRPKCGVAVRRRGVLITLMEGLDTIPSEYAGGNCWRIKCLSPPAPLPPRVLRGRVFRVARLSMSGARIRTIYVKNTAEQLDRSLVSLPNQRSRSQCSRSRTDHVGVWGRVALLIVVG